MADGFKPILARLVDGQALAVDFTISLKRVDDEAGETGAAGREVRA